MLEAVIFDMDGVIVDSEPFWQRAEKEVLTELGVQVTDKLCKQTQRMTTAEVAQFWFDRNPWSGVTLQESEERVVDRVISLINHHDCIMPGLQALVRHLKSKGIKVGLATNSPYRVIPAVLAKTGLESSFDATISAEYEEKGKPAPDVYLSALDRLRVNPENAMAIEDSNSGIKAARRAGLHVIGFNSRPLRGALYQVESYAQLDLDNLMRLD